MNVAYRNASPKSSTIRTSSFGQQSRSRPVEYKSATECGEKTMEVSRKDNADEMWIAKYRAAMDEIPAQQSGTTKRREAFRKVALRLKSGVSWAHLAVVGWNRDAKTRCAKPSSITRRPKFSCRIRRKTQLLPRRFLRRRELTTHRDPKNGRHLHQDQESKCAKISNALHSE